MSFNKNEFVNNTEIKFDLVLLENTIHFIDLDEFISGIKKILNSNGFVIIKNPKARPYGWGNKEFCADSEEFNENKWIKFRDRLKHIYNLLDNSDHLIKKLSTDFYNYYLLKFYTF